MVLAEALKQKKANLYQEYMSHIGRSGPILSSASPKLFSLKKNHIEDSELFSSDDCFGHLAVVVARSASVKEI